jgi:protocatechuate 3,4-dioxygenase alpha subunit
MYFGDEESANTADPVLGLIEQAHRRQTLVARADGNRYHFDIGLQGDDETVFFDV